MSEISAEAPQALLHAVAGRTGHLCLEEPAREHLLAVTGPRSAADSRRRPP